MWSIFTFTLLNRECIYIIQNENDWKTVFNEKNLSSTLVSAVQLLCLYYSYRQWVIVVSYLFFLRKFKNIPINTAIQLHTSPAILVALVVNDAQKLENFNVLTKYKYFLRMVSVSYVSSC